MNMKCLLSNGLANCPRCSNNLKKRYMSCRIILLMYAGLSWSSLLIVGPMEPWAVSISFMLAGRWLITDDMARVNEYLSLSQNGPLFMISASKGVSFSPLAEAEISGCSM